MSGHSGRRGRITETKHEDNGCDGSDHGRGKTGRCGNRADLCRSRSKSDRPLQYLTHGSGTADGGTRRRSGGTFRCLLRPLESGKHPGAVQRTPARSLNPCQQRLSKKALAEATRTAALHYAPRMRVNGLAPGPVFPPHGLEHLRMEKTLKTLPLGRPVNPHDLADACVMLAANSSITGATLFVDCGQSLL